MASSARIDELRKKFDENPRRYFAPLANEYRKSGDLDQAIFICQEYLPQQPGHMSGHIVYGQALFGTGRLDEARAVFETALTLDPENLIALRHLGDIANGSGDTAAARSWYQRVLEADPRNEEIAALLETLLSKPEIVATARRSLSISRHTPAFSWDGALDPDAVPPAGVDDPLVSPSDMVLERSTEAVTPVVPIAAQPEPAPAEPEAPPVEPEQELYDISEFNIGVEAFASMPTAHEIELDPGPTSEAIDLQPLPGIETSETLAAEAAALFQDDPLAITGFQDDAITPTDQTDEKLTIEDAAPVAPHGDDFAPDSLDPADTLPMGMAAVPAAAPDTPIVTDPDTPIVTDPDTPIVTDPDTPFVTETMAELYLQQGHHREAANIYRQLVERRPSDATLRGRLAELEPPDPPARPAAEEQPAPAPAPVGPSIRTFLRGLLWESPVASTQDGNSLDALFSGGPRGDADDTMASLLAGAYREDESGDDPLRGVPAHRVSGELSLEHVFGDQAGADVRASAEATPPGGHGFLNQFFAGSSSGADAEDAGLLQSEAQPSPAEDIEQFNAWLQGLRNT